MGMRNPSEMMKICEKRDGRRTLLSLSHTKKKKKSLFSISAVVVSQKRRDKEQRREREKEDDFKHVKRQTLSAYPLLVFRV